MNDLLFVLFSSVPFLYAIALAFLCILVGLLGLSKPRMLVYPFLIVLLSVSGNTYGSLDQSARSIYSRGAGLLFFSVFAWGVLASLICVQVARKFVLTEKTYCNLRGWMFAWCLLLAGHVCVGLLLNVPVIDSLSPSGFVNVVWMSALILLIINAIHDSEHLEELQKIILIVALARAVFGLIRWVGFGGDPANAYANRHGLNIKLTFFDINDGLTCLLGVAIAAIRVLRGKYRQSALWSTICWLMLLAGSVCIILSFRRSAWFGFLFATVFVLWFLPARRRWQTVILGTPAVLVGLAYAAIKRLTQTKGAGSLSQLFFEFQDRGIGPVSARQLELLLAWDDFIKKPLFGLGAWGHYSNSELISWQRDDGGGAFLHSGVLHVALKSGVLGLILLAGFYCAFAFFVLRVRKHVEERHLPLFVAGAAGVIFTIPDMLLGTPVPQLRTMMMTGVCFALPYLAARGLNIAPAFTMRPLARHRAAPAAGA